MFDVTDGYQVPEHPLGYRERRSHLVNIILRDEMWRHVPRLLPRHLPALVESVNEGESVCRVLLSGVRGPLQQEVTREVDGKTEDSQPRQGGGVEERQTDGNAVFILQDGVDIGVVRVVIVLVVPCETLHTIKDVVGRLQYFF